MTHFLNQPDELIIKQLLQIDNLATLKKVCQSNKHVRSLCKINKQLLFKSLIEKDIFQRKIVDIDYEKMYYALHLSHIVYNPDELWSHAVQDDSIESMRQLLFIGSQPKESYVLWETVSIDTMKWLVEKRILALDGTAVIYALKNDNPNVLLYLIEEGAPVHIEVNDDLDTLLMYVIKQAYPFAIIESIVRRLSVEQLNDANFEEKTALFYAILRTDSTDIIRLLLEHGSMIQSSEFDAFKYAIELNTPEAVLLFIEFGATLKPEYLEYALKLEYPQIVEILIQHIDITREMFQYTDDPEIVNMLTQKLLTREMSLLNL